MVRTRHFWTRTAMPLFVAVALGVLAAGGAQARTAVVLPRPGQVGVSLGGLYGTLLDAGSVGEQFGSGPGLAVRLRYRMRFDRGFGLSFENHGADVRGIDPQRRLGTAWTMAANADTAYRKCSLFLYGVDFYQMFGTRTKTTTMLSVGGGIAHPQFILNDGEYEAPPFGDGTYLAIGAGVERFFWQSMAFDVAARYHAVFLGERVNHDLQATVGLIYYASL
jgi:hypothetical protein